MRKSIHILLFSFITGVTCTNAQRSPIDSLEQLLEKESRDSSRALLMAELSHIYHYSDPSKALSLAQQGYDLSKEIHFRKGEAVCLNRIANVFRSTGNLPKALELNLEALKKAEEIGEKYTINRITSDIGIVYFFQLDYKKALEYAYQAKEIAEQINNENRLMISFNNIGDAYYRLNRLDSALEYMLRSYQAVLKQNNILAIGPVELNLGNIYSKLGELDSALKYYRIGVPRLMLVDDDDGVSEANLGMARLYLKEGLLDSCLFYAKASLNIGIKAGFIQRIMEASDFLTSYYKNHKLIDSAFVYLQLNMAAKDSFFSHERVRQLQNLSIDESMRQREILEAKAAAEEERRMNIQYAVIAISLVTFLVIFILLARGFIFNQKWIRFLGVLGLLLLFEFINLLIHPFLANITHHSPILMLSSMVVIAAMLVPLHHRVEHWIVNKLIIKNNKLKKAITKVNQPSEN